MDLTDDFVDLLVLILIQAATIQAAMQLCWGPAACTHARRQWVSALGSSRARPQAVQRCAVSGQSTNTRRLGSGPGVMRLRTWQLAGLALQHGQAAELL